MCLRRTRFLEFPGRDLATSRPKSQMKIRRQHMLNANVRRHLAFVPANLGPAKNFHRWMAHFDQSFALPDWECRFVPKNCQRMKSYDGREMNVNYS
jgi:hypothetical protein